MDKAPCANLRANDQSEPFPPPDFHGIDASMTESSPQPSAAAAIEPCPTKRVELTVRGRDHRHIDHLRLHRRQRLLGLKVALTFASSIPAAVISMAVLRLFKGATIWENNIVQTVASAAGTLSSVIFVLPGLVMIGWWTGFPFWQSFGVCAARGVLGVMYTIPLRRALVTQSTLPYPEGVAAAEVLKVGRRLALRRGRGRAPPPRSRRPGFWTVAWGSLLSAAFAAITGRPRCSPPRSARLISASGPRIGDGVSASMSLALVGAGHLMGIAVGVAMLAGLVISWGFAVPILTICTRWPARRRALRRHVAAVFKTQVRFLRRRRHRHGGDLDPRQAGRAGDGAACARPWRTSQAGFGGHGRRLPRSERDMPIWIVGLICLVTLPRWRGCCTAFLSGRPCRP